MKTSLPGNLVLMYHSINHSQTNPWNITVSPDYFEAQVKFLKDNFYVISVDELIHQIKQNNIKNDCVCITFDDGYADNFTNAKPVLEKYDCPATFFIATKFFGHKIFWWDELESIFLYTEKMPGILSLTINERVHKYHIAETQLTTEQLLLHKKWKWYQDAPTTRCKVFIKIWKALRPLHLDVINQVINEIKLWAQVKVNKTFDRYTMNEQQLQLLAKHELFSIGLHTHTHIDLHGKSNHIQHEEIANCKDLLLSNYNVQTNILAYPYGRFDANSFNVADTLHLDACFTTEAGVINNKSNKYFLPRWQVCEWNDAEFNLQLNELLNSETLINS